MAEEGISTRSEGGAQGRPDPENGSAVGIDLLQKKAKKTLEEHFSEVVVCILNNIRGDKLSSAKLLVDLAGSVRTGKEVREEKYVSLAEVLWKAIQEEEQEAVNGN